MSEMNDQAWKDLYEIVESCSLLDRNDISFSYRSTDNQYILVVGKSNYYGTSMSAAIRSYLAYQRELAQADIEKFKNILNKTDALLNYLGDEKTKDQKGKEEK